MIESQRATASPTPDEIHVSRAVEGPSRDARPTLVSPGVLFSGLIISSALFYLFTFNSGFGYDALEYLVIGRNLAEGGSPYSLIPSKGPGIYYLVAAFIAGGVPANHYTVSALITALFAATLISTWLAARPFFDFRITVLATVLVAGCAVFMELNFLEPESLVVIFSLAAFALLLHSLRTGGLLIVLAAGFSLALGFQFKSVAAFYLAGMLGFLLFRCFRQRSLDDFSRRALMLCAGFLIGISIAAAFFAITGRLSEYWIWSFAFPLIDYPANTFWLPKLFTKLLWFHLLLAVALSCSLFVKRIRNIVWRHDATVLAFFLGGTSYLALLKTQASHYFFPGAVFFSIFTAAILVTLLKETRWLNVSPIAIAVAVVLTTLALVASIVLYEPRAFARLMIWRDYQQESLIGAQLRQQVDAEAKGLFVRDGMLLHWVSKIEPAARFVDFDVQAAYFLKKNPAALLKALDNESTKIVEFNPEDPGFEAAHFKDFAERTGLLVDFKKALDRDFKPAEISPAPYHLWIRKTAGER